MPDVLTHPLDAYIYLLGVGFIAAFALFAFAALTARVEAAIWAICRHISARQAAKAQQAAEAAELARTAQESELRRQAAAAWKAEADAEQAEAEAETDLLLAEMAEMAEDAEAEILFAVYIESVEADEDARTVKAALDAYEAALDR